MGNWFRPRGYNIHYHPVLIDWVKHLNRDYEKLEEDEIDHCIVHINNCICHDMKWRSVYNIDYNPQTQTFILHGFPKRGFPEFFKVSPSQLKWTLHRMGYNHAKVHLKEGNVLFIELYLDDDIDEALVEFVDVEEENPNDLPDNFNSQTVTDCNILTPEEYEDRGLLDF